MVGEDVGGPAWALQVLDLSLSGQTRVRYDAVGYEYRWGNRLRDMMPLEECRWRITWKTKQKHKHSQRSAHAHRLLHKNRWYHTCCRPHLSLSHVVLTCHSLTCSSHTSSHASSNVVLMHHPSNSKTYTRHKSHPDIAPCSYFG